MGSPRFGTVFLRVLGAATPKPLKNHVIPGNEQGFFSCNDERAMNRAYTEEYKDGILGKAWLSLIKIRGLGKIRWKG